MDLRWLTRLPALGLGMTLTAPRYVLHQSASLAGTLAHAAGEVVGAIAGVARGEGAAAGAAVRVVRVARHAMAGTDGRWQAGQRFHLPLRARPGRGGAAGRGAEAAVAEVAAELRQRTDVRFAYWDSALARLVVHAAPGTAADGLVDVTTELAAKHGLAPSAEPAEGVPHPGDVRDVRMAAAALAFDAAGIAATMGARALHLPRASHLATATVSLLREDPRWRRALRRRLGRTATDVLLAAAHATAHAAVQSPTPIVLDAVVRAAQLVEAVARAAAFDAVHDEVCVPGRMGVGGEAAVSRPAPADPVDDYAAKANAVRLAGGAGALLLNRNLDYAARAVLAGSPKALRHGSGVYLAGIGCVLAREGVLVRAPERLRLLPAVDTAVLHASALRGADPRVATVLDAARRAGLRVLVVGGPAPGEAAAPAGGITGTSEPLPHVVHDLQRNGHVVLTVARLRTDGGQGGQDGGAGAPADSDVLAGLLGSDIAVALADQGSAVVWAADVLCPRGLAGVWRLLVAVPASRRVQRHAKVFAEAGGTLAGLLLLTESVRLWGMPPVSLGANPVTLADAAAMVLGFRSVAAVAVSSPPTLQSPVSGHAPPPKT
ncbi:hypothetical protein [Streptomyces flaveus]|uniref:hypothetical protein n=1 Tax=Streptomyces flaveus TaxID=66370 RepID=UPI00332DDBB4